MNSTLYGYPEASRTRGLGAASAAPATPLTSVPRPRPAAARLPAQPGVMQVVLSLSAGGTERLVIDMCSRLRDELKLVVCCLDDCGSWAEQLRQQGIEVVSLRRQPGFQPGIGRRIAQLAAERGVGV